jgi:F420-dependent methylenetetrahydromethanopterin dehydrogenase
MTSFDKDILKKLESLFPENTLKTLVYRVEDDKKTDLPVKVIYMPSNIECVCDKYESQIKNKAMAIVDLASKVGIAV